MPKRLLALAIALVLTNHSISWACDCQRQSLIEQYAQAHSVIKAEVISIDFIQSGTPSIFNPGKQMAKIRVLEVFKGDDLPKELTAITRMPPAALCNSGLKLNGELALVFLSASFHTIACGSNKISRPENGDVDMFNEMRKIKGMYEIGASLKAMPSRRVIISTNSEFNLDTQKCQLIQRYI